MSDLVYVGFREEAGPVVWRFCEGRWAALPFLGCQEMWLPLSYDWRNDSPSAFALSLALCRDVIDNPSLAVQLHMEFWRLCVKALPVQVWALLGDSLKALLLEIYHHQTNSDGVPLWRVGSYKPHPLSSGQRDDVTIVDLWKAGE